jgi:hypothetical protein
MTRHTLLLGTVFVTALAVSVSAHPAPTASETQTNWLTGPESLISAQIHGALGASFRTISAGF